jgi:hypothetical protein
LAAQIGSSSGQIDSSGAKIVSCAAKTGPGNRKTRSSGGKARLARQATAYASATSAVLPTIAGCGVPGTLRKETNMDSSEMKIFEMFTRVRDFGGAHAADFPVESLGGRLFTEIGSVIEALNAQTATQTSGLAAARESTSGKAVARNALRSELEMMTRTARAMAIDTPGLDDKFRLPRSNADQALLNAARAYRADAEPLKADFIAHAMPEDFLETLDELVGDFEEQMATGNRNAAAHIAASAAIDAEIERGMTVARRLDPIVRNKYHNNPGVLAVWTSARHVERAGRKAAKPPASPPPDKA